MDTGNSVSIIVLSVIYDILSRAVGFIHLMKIIMTLILGSSIQFNPENVFFILD